MKYRKKPVVIEAFRCSGLLRAAANDWIALPPAIQAAYEKRELLFDEKKKRIIIKTLEGNMTAEVDDMVIVGVKGEIYPCKPDIFADTYEPAE